MKFVLVLAALLALVCAQNSTMNSTSTTGVFGTTGVQVTNVDITLYNAAVGANATSGACSNATQTLPQVHVVHNQCMPFTAIQVPGFNVSVIATFAGESNATFVVYLASGGNACGTNIGSGTLRNGQCSLLSISVFGTPAPTWVKATWGSSLSSSSSSSSSSTSSSSTGDSAGVAVLPSFLASAFAALFLLARF